MKEVREVLMKRDHISAEEADELIEQTKEEIQMWLDRGDYESAMDVFSDNLGLEPDYLDEFFSNL